MAMMKDHKQRSGRPRQWAWWTRWWFFRWRRSGQHAHPPIWLYTYCSVSGCFCLRWSKRNGRGFCSVVRYLLGHACEWFASLNLSLSVLSCSVRKLGNLWRLSTACATSLEKPSSDGCLCLVNVAGSHSNFSLLSKSCLYCWAQRKFYCIEPENLSAKSPKDSSRQESVLVCALLDKTISDLDTKLSGSHDYQAK